MIWAATGTRRGGTAFQLAAVGWLWSRYGISELHDGDAIGVDYQLYHLGKAFGANLVMHPPTNPKYRAWCGTPKDKNRLPKPYHARDKDMVDESKVLVSVQLKAEEMLRGGTRHTTDYARAVKRPIALVWPNGHISYENWNLRQL